jgi:hypothetical protein
MMNEDAKLHTRRINHGRSEIWLEADGRELTQRRILATNEVLNVARRYCVPEVFNAFYASNRTVVDEVATLVAPNLDEIATELNLRA